jgi:BirA family transcriptional regulator, biotin operon repressor / biotin---[acetyl-CoA-carboxylase] ligase
MNNLLIFPCLASTNTHTRELLQNASLEEGTIVWAREQTAGRGFGSNKWESEAGKNITLSVLLKPHFLAPHDQFWLTKVLSLALRDLVKDLIGTAGATTIKWPNDIYVDHRKIAGILVENSIMGDQIRESICGIGFNVNQEIFCSDAPNPVSLAMITQKQYDLNEIVMLISKNLNHWYRRLQESSWELINLAYHNSLYRINTPAGFVHDNQPFTGTIRGTDSFGHLQIELTDGQIRNFDFKEVSFEIQH